MTFLQPWMLYGLPVVLLPILIHLLNRLRYRTVRWAAMLFLLRADRKAARRAQIKQWILLAIRILVMGLLVLALARPILGGWLGWAASGGPDLVVILLDRSASMETIDPRYQVSRREQGLNLLAAVTAEDDTEGHFVLIDSGTREALPLTNLEHLPRLAQTGPGNGACDWPGLFRLAAEAIEKDEVAQAEIWILSDLQKASWSPQSAEWKNLLERLDTPTRQLRVRLLDLSGPPQADLHLTVQSVKTVPLGSKARVDVELVCHATEDLTQTVPLSVTLEGARQSREIRVQGLRSQHTLSFELERLPEGGGWGRIDLPADANPGNNAAWFVFGQPLPMHASVASEDEPVRQVLRFAAAPDPTDRNRTALAEGLEEAGGLPFDQSSFVIWQGGAPTPATELALKSVLARGGAVLVFPPLGSGTDGPLEIKWNASEAAAEGEYFTVGSWDELDGPLRNTENGMPLALARLQVIRRRLGLPAEEAEAWHMYASFADGTPMLLGRKVGGGRVYICSTLPDPTWSSLGDGFVLVPMVHRIFHTAASGIAAPSLGECGIWQPASTREVWLPESDTGKDWRSASGVYRNDLRLIALNTPEAESETATLDGDEVEALLAPLPVQVVAEAMKQDTESMLTEVASVGIMGMMGLMLLETLLILGWARPAVNRNGA